MIIKLQKGEGRKGFKTLFEIQLKEVKKALT